MIASTAVKGVFQFRVKKKQNGNLQPTFSNFLSNFNMHQVVKFVQQVWITRPQTTTKKTDSYCVAIAAGKRD